MNEYQRVTALLHKVKGKTELRAHVAEAIGRSGVPVQIGYQRRFDAAFAAAKAAVDGGTLGALHTVRSTTMDPAPPPLDYIKGSGGIFRDCAVHDFDTVRWITGQEAVEVYATGSVQGDPLFTEYGDVDTAEGLHGGIEQRRDVGGHGQIALRLDRSGSGGPYRVHGAVGIGLRSRAVVVHHDIDALAAQGGADQSTEVLRSGRDDRGPAYQFDHTAEPNWSYHKTETAITELTTSIVCDRVARSAPPAAGTRATTCP